MIRQLKDKLLCPLVSSLIQVTIIFVVFFEFYEFGDEYKSLVKRERITKRIETRVNECGQGYFISWLVIKNNTLKNKFSFEDVIGCYKNKSDCSYSVKKLKLNKYYNEEYHKIDKQTYEFLSQLKPSAAAYFNDMNSLKDYPAIFEALENSNKNIYEIGLSAVKDIRHNLIYVFTLTNTTQLKTCNKDRIVYILEDLSTYAKENL